MQRYQRFDRICMCSVGINEIEVLISPADIVFEIVSSKIDCAIAIVDKAVAADKKTLKFLVP